MATQLQMPRLPAVNHTLPPNLIIVIPNALMQPMPNQIRSIQIPLILQRLVAPHRVNVLQPLQVPPQSQNVALIPFQQRIFRDLRNVRLQELFAITITEESTLVWCQQHGLIPIIPAHCNTCGAEMTRYPDYKRENFRFQCKNSNCKSMIHIRRGTFFEGSHLSLRTIVQFVYCWSMEFFQTTDFQFQLGQLHQHSRLEELLQRYLRRLLHSSPSCARRR